MTMEECSLLFREKFPFWNALSENEKVHMCRHAVYTSYKKGENIHGNCGVCTGMILVKTGCVRAYLLSEEGREITLYRLYAGDVCMLSPSCILHTATFDAYYDAQEDSECYVINGTEFAKITERNVYAENFALSITAQRLSEVIWVMEQIMFMSFDRRLAMFLLTEAQKTGETDIRLTHEQIAKYTGSAREVVSRMLKYFSSEGIVSLSRGGVKILNVQKLQDLAV